MAFFLSEERRNYYRAKKAEQARQAQASLNVKEDALFIHYYGMSAYLELFPDAKGFSINWHREIIIELKKIDKINLGNQLSGMAMAIAANLSKKSRRKFKQLIRGMMK